MTKKSHINIKHKVPQSVLTNAKLTENAQSKSSTRISLVYKGIQSSVTTLPVFNIERPNFSDRPHLSQIQTQKYICLFLRTKTKYQRNFARTETLLNIWEVGRNSLGQHSY